MIVDLVSPWLAANDAINPVRAVSAFRDRHAGLFETLRRVRAPSLDLLPLCGDRGELPGLARTAADPAVHQLLRDMLAGATALGADRCQRVVLVAGGGAGDASEPVPSDGGEVVLFVEFLPDEDARVVALARGVAALTRWTAPDSLSPVVHEFNDSWDRWNAARAVALREWIYTEGLGRQLAQALLPALKPNALFGLKRAAFNRLRQRERIFHALLDADLDKRGIGPILRWLSTGAPLSARTVHDVVVPPMAGHYLAWRMLADRVARAGLREAIRAQS